MQVIQKYEPSSPTPKNWNHLDEGTTTHKPWILLKVIRIILIQNESTTGPTQSRCTFKIELDMKIWKLKKNKRFKWSVHTGWNALSHWL